MQAGNTLQVRKAINEAFDELKQQKHGTWTDPVNWSDYSGPMRVVTYRTSYAYETAALAQKKLRDAGFNNEVRVTDTDACLPCGMPSGGGPYIRVNAELA